MYMECNGFESHLRQLIFNIHIHVLCRVRVSHVYHVWHIGYEY